MLFADLIPLFAQAGGRGGPPPGVAEGGMIAFIIAYFVFLAVMIVISIMFLLAMSKALNACAPRNRTMEPGQVWLSLIPVVGIVFYLMAIFKVPDSLANEYRDRGMRGDGDYGKNLGLWFVITSFVCPGVNLILWIMYWVKIHGHTKELMGSGGYDRPRRSKRRDDRDDDDDYEDDRPRRRRRDEDD